MISWLTFPFEHCFTVLWRKWVIIFNKPASKFLFLLSTNSVIILPLFLSWLSNIYSKIHHTKQHYTASHLGVDIQCVDVWAKHVVPEGQALGPAIRHRGAAQVSLVIGTARAGRLDKDVVAITCYLLFIINLSSSTIFWVFQSLNDPNHSCA